MAGFALYPKIIICPPVFLRNPLQNIVLSIKYMRYTYRYPGSRGGMARIMGLADQSVSEPCSFAYPVSPDNIEKVAYKNTIAGDQAINAVRTWWRSTRVICCDIERESLVTGCRLTYIPFWKVSARVTGWIEGRDYLDYDSDATVNMIYRFRQHMIWSRIAGEARDDGVDVLPASFVTAIASKISSPIESEKILPAKNVNASGLEAMKEVILNSAHMNAGITSQDINFCGNETVLAYYPIWIVYYTCQQQTFNATVDGVTGTLLYGKAPADMRARFITAGALIGIHAAVPASVVLAGWKLAAIPMFLIITGTFFIQDGVAVVRFGTVITTGGRTMYKPWLNKKRNNLYRWLCYLFGILSFVSTVFLIGWNNSLTKIMFTCGFVFFLTAVVLTSDSEEVTNNPIMIDEGMPGSFAKRTSMDA